MDQQVPVSLDSIDDVRPLHNQLILEIEEQDSIKTAGGLHVLLDASFNPGFHFRRYGRVVKNPDKLIFSKNHHSSMEWKTEIQTAVGDIVWYDYAEVFNNARISVGEKIYYLVNYGDLYLIKKQGDWGEIMWSTVVYPGEGDPYTVIMLNGNLLCSVTDKYKSAIIKTIAEEDKRFGRVEYAGLPNEDYLDKRYSDLGEIGAGDNVLFGQLYQAPLEEGCHLDFDGKEYKIVQRRFISAVIDD